tara:strand:- start:88123 stop:89421 length:1299 start_codon:yes stop_codon:yes gene_type:complete
VFAFTTNNQPPSYFNAALWLVSASVIALGFYLLLWHPNALAYHVQALAITWAGFLIVSGFCKTRGFNSALDSPWLLGAIILIFALLFRVQVISASPFLADDYLRYLFDGKLILAGINPYAVTPLSVPELGGADIPKADIKTIYPPLAEGLFAISSWLGGSLWHWRLLNLIPDLLGAAVFYRYLIHRRLPGHWVVLWLWNPLILKEGLHAAHLDIWTLFTVMLFVYWAEKKKLSLAALALAAAVLLKLMPLILLPVWLMQLPNRRDRLITAGLTLGGILLGFSWFLPWHPFGNIAVFLQHIQGYGVLFKVLGQGFGVWQLDSEWIKWLLTSVGGALALYWVFILKRYQAQPTLRLLELFLLLYVFSSMGFPWYLLLVLPWVLIQGHWLWLVFIALSELVFYSYQLDRQSNLLTAAALLALLLAAYQQKVNRYV